MNCLFSYKCDSQCALEMRCPPGLIFDDVYQRCEWPGAGSQPLNQRLGSLRDKQHDDNKNTTQTKVKKLRVMTTLKQLNATLKSTTFSSSTSPPLTTVSSTNQTTKLVEP
jgi:hypothetical protein